MHITSSNEKVAIASDSILNIYALEGTLIQEYQKNYTFTITSLHSSPEFLIIGLFNGTINLLNYNNKREFNIYNFEDKVTCIFNIGSIYYFGCEDGNIVIMLIKQSTMNTELDLLSSQIFYEDTMTSDIDSSNAFTYTTIGTIKHNAPVVSICSDGSKTYILDIRGKIIIKDEGSFDIFGSCMRFKNYLFISEKNIIYCKTTEAFACWLRCDEIIQEFVFNKTGSICIVKYNTRIDIFYKSKLLKTLRCNGKFIYDENRNRIIIYNGKIEILDDIVDDAMILDDEMDKIVFRETNIVEKKIKMKEDLNEPKICKFVDNGIKTDQGSKIIATKKKEKKLPYQKHEFINEFRYKNNVARKFDLKEEKEDSELAELFSNDGHESEMYKEDFHNGYEESIEEPEVISYKNHYKIFASGSYKCEEDLELLCFNKIGYIIKTPNLIEINYHDNSYPRKSFKENFNLGSVSEKGILLANEESLYFNGNTEWRKNIENILLCTITSKMIICLLKSEVRIFKFSGIEIFYFRVDDPVTMCAENENIAIFCRNEIITVNQYFNVSRHNNINTVDFCCMENNALYCVIENILYVLENSILRKCIEVKNYPLCINNNHLITFKKNLLPTPNIEYYPITHPVIYSEQNILEMLKDAVIKNDTCLIEDLYGLLKDDKNKVIYKTYLEKDTYIDDSISDSVFDKDFRSNENYENISNTNINTVKENSVKKKRFNPFAKKK